jgi:hypothetical protein
MDPSEIAVALARIEGKLDLQNAQSIAQASRSDDHEMRLREHAREIADLKAQPTVSPKQLASWLTLGLASVGTAGPFVIFALR